MSRPQPPSRTHLLTRALGSAPVAATARLASRGRLPVLAYHDVPDAAAFERHLEFICRHYRPVSGEQVASIGAGGRLPSRAVWITFDDAHPGVFANAMPLLAQRGLPATVFVCPGVVDTDRPYWWQVLDLAITSGQSVTFGSTTWSDASVITHLKRAKDDDRRSVVARVRDELTAAGVSVSVPQATSDALRSWLDAGLEVGNHTWDHPCLDTCDEDEQRRQITAADDWLRDLIGRQPCLFAYPNGNVTRHSRDVLAERGYEVTALFDHRLARPRGSEISRLRVDATAPLDRLAAITSGAHPAVFTLLERVRGRRRTPEASR